MNKVANKILVSAVLVVFSVGAYAESDDTKPDEEVVVTGTQIRGANISDALPVSVISDLMIEDLGIDSGDELLEFMAENGQNFFGESDNISGGVNSARGDIGAYNLRNLGTGNTLVLLNGRRLVNAASYQTEEVGGSFVPVNTVNSQSLPISGLRRTEVLRDGASAIYGADAVAGVVNYVLKDDFEGFSVRGKYGAYDHIPRDDQTLTVEWGKNLGNSTNVAVFLNYFQRDRVNSQDELRWFNSDYRDRLPPDSRWLTEPSSTTFRNNSANSEYRQFDIVGSASGFGLRNVITDSAGDWETYPSGDPRCQYEIGYGTCGGVDGQGTFRHNINENRDLFSELDRTNLYAILNHDFNNGVESYTEFSLYLSNTNTIRHASAPFSTVDLIVGAENYYNPLGPCGSPNRLPDSIIGTDVPCAGVEMAIENGRFTEVPRIVDNDGTTFRFLQGFRGEWGVWDWDTAFIYSKAEKEDITHNRVSNTLMTEALADPTPAAYNPFSGRVNTNIERTLIDVRRDNETELTLIDFKISRNDIFELPAGPVGFLAGVEYRDESFVDDRDPRLDGTIRFDLDPDSSDPTDTFPYISDVVNSSPSPDSRGDRQVTSLFGELQIPVLSNLDVQLALRHENFSDVKNATVGKFAVGFRPIEQVLLRGSWSEAFRAPNLVTINEEIVARQNTRTDYACEYAEINGMPPSSNTLDCRNSTQRIAQGSKNLIPEESTNTSIGIVFEPYENLTFTLDFWSIEKENTIGLFGEENHTILDLLNRINAGTASCSTFIGNPAVHRETTVDMDVAAVYLNAGICPAGDITFIDDNYANLDDRNVSGHDLGIYYDIDTPIGEIDIRMVAAYLDKFDQKAGGQAAVLVAAQDAGTIPANFPVAGFADLIGADGNAEDKYSLRVGWRKGSWRGSLSALRLGDFYQDSLTLSDGTRYVIAPMTTINGSLQYSFDYGDIANARVRIGIRNIFDERAPLADVRFGYFSDMHKDLGRSAYIDLKLGFN